MALSNKPLLSQVLPMSGEGTCKQWLNYFQYSLGINFIAWAFQVCTHSGRSSQRMDFKKEWQTIQNWNWILWNIKLHGCFTCWPHSLPTVLLVDSPFVFFNNPPRLRQELPDKPQLQLLSEQARPGPNVWIRILHISTWNVPVSHIQLSGTTLRRAKDKQQHNPWI